MRFSKEYNFIVISGDNAIKTHRYFSFKNEYIARVHMGQDLAIEVFNNRFTPEFETTFYDTIEEFMIDWKIISRYVLIEKTGQWI